MSQGQTAGFLFLFYKQWPRWVKGRFVVEGDSAMVDLSNVHRKDAVLISAPQMLN